MSNTETLNHPTLGTCISATKLRQKLGNTGQLERWVKDHLSTFIEDTDYITNKGEYILTLDTATAITTKYKSARAGYLLKQLAQMNQVDTTVTPVPVSNGMTMSSLEIAALTGKAHPDVTKDIVRILTEAGIDAGDFQSIYLDSMNRNQTCYHLPRRECDLVVSGYSTKYRLKFINYWHQFTPATLQLPSQDVLDQRKLTLMEPVLQEEVRLYHERMLENDAEQRAKLQRQIALDAKDIAQRNAALDQRKFILIDGMKVRADMQASKAALPVVPITHLLKGTKLSPAQANIILYGMGLLEPNTKSGSKWQVTEKGAFYGRNHTSSKLSKDSHPYWYEGTDLIERVLEAWHSSDEE